MYLLLKEKKKKHFIFFDILLISLYARNLFWTIREKNAKKSKMKTPNNFY
jgi:hypothetical protein